MCAPYTLYTNVSARVARMLEFCSMSRARYRWAVYVLSPRDGGWVRFGGLQRSEQHCLELVEAFRPLWQLSGDYEAFQFRRTIAFR